MLRGGVVTPLCKWNRRRGNASGWESSASIKQRKLRCPLTTPTQMWEQNELITVCVGLQ